VKTRELAWRLCVLQGHDDGDPVNPCAVCLREAINWLSQPLADAPAASPTDALFGLRVVKDARVPRNEIWLSNDPASLDQLKLDIEKFNRIVNANLGADGLRRT
jgi:hypothetical protein